VLALTENTRKTKCELLDENLKLRERIDALDSMSSSHEHDVLQLNSELKNNVAKRTLEHLAESEERLSLATVSNGVGIWDFYPQTEELIWDDSMFSLFHIKKEDFSGAYDAWVSSLHPDDREQADRELHTALSGGKNFDTDFRIIWPSGEIRNIKGIANIFRDKAGKPIRMLGINADITKQKKAEEKLKLSSRVFHDTHEGIIITDTNKSIVDVNPAFCEITGYSHDEVIDQNPRILSSGKQNPEFYRGMWQTINEQGHWQGEIWNRKKSGEIYAELLSISVLKDDNGNVVNYICLFTDITSSKQQQEKLSLMAHYDVLTGLPNRTLFADRFHQAIAHSKRTKSQLAVCFLDLDNFKPINDNFGHEVGDQLLIEVAERITATIREEDTVSRQGGDEFAMLLNDIETYAQCEQALERIHHSLAEPYLINGHTHKITASSGITLYPSDDADIDTLLRHADQAMYQAKLSGKHHYHLFNAEHDQQVIRKHNRLKIIEFALANDEFELYYQPKVNMVTGEVFGAEALIRWNHPEKGLIPPLDFLPIIEGSELEIKVGNWVIEQALQQLDTWQQQGIKLEVSVNISSHHLLSTSFFAELESALANYPEVNSNYLQLEILESSALSDLNAISSIIKTCQSALGTHVALDDFGTGYSSLTHLRNLPADTIKIDRSFVVDMLDDPSDYAIIDGVIGLADSFNRGVIAEGVETTNHGLMLLLMGCEQAQGYGIAKPMSANDFAEWLTHYIPNQYWLRCGKKHRTTKESKVELFKLIISQWKDKFITNIQSSSEAIKHWPIMDRKQCHCNDWLKRARQTQFFEQQWLDNLGKEHVKVHALADDLRGKYQHGHIELARDGLAELHIIFDDINKLLELECFIPVVK
jgi:diguanylate cyclase (GGDEF)-like protein/PAS domain S-box-containing protein